MVLRRAAVSPVWLSSLLPCQRRACSSPALASEIAARLRSDANLARDVAVSLDKTCATEMAAAWEEAEAKASAATRGVPPPTRRQYRQLFIRQGVPFVGFGFFDNMIMLTVGEAVDTTLGVQFGFSTLAAAGIGQMASDSMGITLQGLIERFADSLGLPDPCLSREQSHLSQVKWMVLVSRIVGIVVGCILGMFPLLFFPEKPGERLVDRIEESIPPENRAEFARCVRNVTYKPGEKLIALNMLSSSVFLILEGSAEVVGVDTYGVPFVVTTIGPGHAFGEPELHNAAHVDLIAKTEVSVQQISKQDFLRLTSEAGKAVLAEARSPESAVYMAAQGLGGVQQYQPKRRTGKTRFFARLSQEDKCAVLKFTGLPDALEFKGREHEGKVQFFAKLSEQQKCDALNSWNQAKTVQAK
eukprot:Hpha_TRINITY_DN3862_c0_g1::TRINITY_DN3862_c0_g1_i1::g.44637::m.44637